MSYWRAFVLHWRQRNRTPFLSRSWYSWRFDLMGSSRAILMGIFLAWFIDGYHSSNMDTFLLIGFFTIFSVVTLWINHFFRPRVHLDLNLSERAVCGEKIPFSVRIRNKSKRKGRDIVVQAANTQSFLTIEPEQQYIPLLEPEEEYTFHFESHFHQRGNFFFRGLRVDSAFPFGFYRLGHGKKGKKNIIVYPNFFPLENFQIPTGRKYHPGGVALVSEVGDSMEYIGNREYLDGDDLRDIDWSSWARLGKPVVREYQEEYFCRVALVFDAQVSRPLNKGREKFEASLSLAAAVVDYLSRQEHIIEIFAAGPEVYFLESGRALAHMEQVFEILACLEPSPQNLFEKIETAMHDRISLLTSAIIILSDLDQTRIDFLEKLHQLDIGLKVLLCTEKADQFENLISKQKWEIVTVSPQCIKEGGVVAL